MIRNAKVAVGLPFLGTSYNGSPKTSAVCLAEYCIVPCAIAAMASRSVQ